MQIKNAHAFRALLIVADENGNHMHVSHALAALLSISNMSKSLQLPAGSLVLHT